MYPEIQNAPGSNRQPPPIPEEVHRMDSNQLAWLSGYLYGLSGTKSASPALPGAAGISSKSLTVVYASQTGNCRAVAERFFRSARERGVEAKLFDVEEFPVSRLADSECVLILISTHGNGDPPDSAAEFFEDLMDSEFEEDFSNLEFSILAFGDRSYEHFCKSGRDLGKRLKELNAKEWMPTRECDVDYKSTVDSWEKAVFEKIKEEGGGTSAAGSISSIQSAEAGYDRENPFSAMLRKNTLICDEGADKEVHHLEFSIKGSGLTYEPGDALGVFPLNSDENVKCFLEHFKANASEEIVFGEGKAPLQNVLSEKVDLLNPTRNLILRLKEKKWISLSDEIFSDEEKIQKYLSNHSTLDILKLVDSSFPVREIISVLPEIAPRLYSISSSQKAHSGEVHLTVKKCVHRLKSKEGQGLCSGFLSELSPKNNVKVYVHSNRFFRLPEENETPVILIGSGTGIAPYRSFLHDMENRGYRGDSWLIFGEQRFQSTFFYQAEIRRFLKNGVLSRFNGAFSRDGKEKIYVQHKIEENSKDFFEWIQRGAVIYLCGDAKKMAVDVEKTILRIIRNRGGKTAEEAKKYFKKITAEKKFRKDVY